jgi:diguanylate cyclase (GGDEF)-like protein
MPSVFLEQGGRLRCQAARGYWMVFDGVPPQFGVIGTAFRSGVPTHVGDVRKRKEYVSMVHAVKAELAVPLVIANRVVGVLNAEATTPIGEKPMKEIERVAALLSRRLVELGPLDDASPGQRLARAAARSAQMEDADGVIREAAAAAREVSGLESVMVALNDGAGGAHVHHAAGPLAEVLAGLGDDALASMAQWVQPGITALTLGDPAGKSLPAAEPLRRAGAGALAVVPLAVGRAKLGFMALADRSSVVLRTEQAELLELLGVQTAAQLRGLAAIVELRDRAAQDPLTGLGHRAAFLSRLPRRRRRTAEAGRQLAVMLAEVDGLGDVNERGGHDAGDEVLRETAALLGEVTDATAFRVGGDEFALILDFDERSTPQEVAWELQAQARERLGTTLSIGVALAAADEPADDLLERAGTALVEVKRRGRDGVALAPSRTT